MTAQWDKILHQMFNPDSGEAAAPVGGWREPRAAERCLMNEQVAERQLPKESLTPPSSKPLEPQG